MLVLQVVEHTYIVVTSVADCELSQHLLTTRLRVLIEARRALLLTWREGFDLLVGTRLVLHLLRNLCRQVLIAFKRMLKDLGLLRAQGRQKTVLLLELALNL